VWAWLASSLRVVRLTRHLPIPDIHEAALNIQCICLGLSLVRSGVYFSIGCIYEQIY